MPVRTDNICLGIIIILIGIDSVCNFNYFIYKYIRFYYRR